jgi:ABC-type nitrate/sulfonate/bicarbonate transport system substrate-binding protein
MIIVRMTAGEDAVSAISTKKVDAVFLPHPFPTSIEKEVTGALSYNLDRGDRITYAACF